MVFFLSNHLLNLCTSIIMKPGCVLSFLIRLGTNDGCGGLDLGWLLLCHRLWGHFIYQS